MARIAHIPMETVRDNSFTIAQRMVGAGIFPTVIYAVTRGGVYVANPISEYYSYIGRKMKYGVVNAYSYHGIDKRSAVVVEGWVPGLDKLALDDKVLIVEDVVDTRESIKAILLDIESKTKLRRDMMLPVEERSILIAAHDFKIRYDVQDSPKTRPDFYAKRWIVGKDEENVWIIYLSH